MDRHSWLRRKKSSDRTIIEKPVDSSGLGSVHLASIASLKDEEINKKFNVVQLSADGFTHFTGLKKQVKTLISKVRMLENQVKDLNEDLSQARSEMIEKDSLIQKHAEVAEEALSGWEKAEDQNLSLKHQLELITLLPAERKASHLDGSLKEHLRQLRRKKENTKRNAICKIMYDLEAKIAELDQALITSAAENAALSRSLQEHSVMLLKIKEEKSQEDADVKLLKGSIRAYEKELSSVRHQLGMVSDEMNTRKNETGSKKLLDDLKKISKIEDEITAVKESLVAPNTEVEGLRTMCVEMDSRIKDMEAQIQIIEETHKQGLQASALSGENARKPSSLTPMSDDGVDGEASMGDSWTGASLVSESSHKRDQSKPEKNPHLKLMDFFQMERPASIEEGSEQA